jgi:hypothetical protein
MDCTVETITPSIAAELLSLNIKNRPINESHVAFFEEQLKRGEMLLTHQGIAISDNARLLDGQHRLTAIVRTGISAEILVTRGLSEKVFTVLDSGSKRSAGDVLAIAGASNASALATGIRMYIAYQNIPDNIWTGGLIKQKCTAKTIAETYHSDKSAWEACAAIAIRNALNKISVPGSMTCLMYLANRKHGYTLHFLERFAAKLKEGTNLEPGEPILAYRNKMMGNQPIYRGTYSQQARLADYIKLFNACITTQKLKIFKSQPFPPMPFVVDATEAVEDYYLDANNVYSSVLS